MKNPLLHHIKLTTLKKQLHKKKAFISTKSVKEHKIVYLNCDQFSFVDILRLNEIFQCNNSVYTNLTLIIKLNFLFQFFKFTFNININIKNGFTKIV